jgi:predicted phosphoadenosine phosphosulfate sulfurtransferase
VKIYLPQTTLEAGHERVGRLFDEFDRVTVNLSGGKDSTVILNLALMEAEKRDKLPVDVMFLDQEAEWDAVIDYVRAVMHDPRVEPHWLQIPFRLFNATSEAQEWLWCWDPENESGWVRPKEPDSIHDNYLGTDRFADALSAFGDVTWPGEKVAQLAGVRCEESPGRLKGLTSHATYRDITWGRKHDKPGHFTFYPIYDWTLVDVWKFIHDHKAPYTRLYDLMYQHGVPLNNMRVSNVHHETAIKSLTFMQEIEPEMWDKLVARVRGVNGANQQFGLFQRPKELPFMFNDWREYRDYLLEHLVVDPERRKNMKQQFADADALYVGDEVLDLLYKTEVAAILVGDEYKTKLDLFRANHGKSLKNYGKRGTGAVHAEDDARG